MFVHICVRICACLFVRTLFCVRVHMCVGAHVYACVCVCVCVFVYALPCACVQGWGGLTRAGLALGEVVEGGVELQAAQQGQAGAALLTALQRGGAAGGGGGGQPGLQGVAEQGQRPRHVALGQLHAHQAQQAVGLGPETTSADCERGAR